MARLSFIASRINGVETYRFAGLPKPYTITRHPNGFHHAQLVGTIYNGWFDTHQRAVDHVFADAQLGIEANGSRL